MLAGSQQLGRSSLQVNGGKSKASVGVPLLQGTLGIDPRSTAIFLPTLINFGCHSLFDKHFAYACIGSKEEPY
jgi:hypothetical protein